MYPLDYSFAVAVSDETIRAFFTALAPTIAALTAWLAAKKGNVQNDELKKQGQIIKEQTDGQLTALQIKLEEEYKKNEDLRKLITALADNRLLVRQAKAEVDAQGKDIPQGELMQSENPFPPAQPNREDKPAI